MTMGRWSPRRLALESKENRISNLRADDDREWRMTGGTKSRQTGRGELFRRWPGCCRWHNFQVTHQFTYVSSAIEYRINKMTSEGGGGFDDSVRVLLFDLDDCLYHSPAMSAAVCSNIKSYMTTFLDIPAAEVDQLCATLYAGHGTTLAGLVNALGKTVDFDHWHEHVHYGKLDYESYLRHDPFLCRCSGRYRRWRGATSSPTQTEARRNMLTAARHR